MSTRNLVFVGLLMEACYASFYGVHGAAGGMLLFILVNALSFVLLACVIWRLSVRPLRGGRSTLALIISFGLLFRLTLVPHVPVASDDMYRYVWDGKVSAHGINPYSLPPNSPGLAYLATDDLPSKVNFPSMRTIYPPLAEAFFLASHLLFGDSMIWMKLLLVLADLASMILLLLLLRDVGLDSGTVVLYAWSPLPIMYFGLDGHIDALAIPFMILTIYCVVKKKSVAGAVVLGLAALAKLYPLVIAPMFCRVGRGKQRFLLPALSVALLALGYWFYFEPSGGLFESLKTFSARWAFNGSLFSLFYVLLGTNELAHLASGVLFLGWLVWLTLAEKTFLEKAFLAFLGVVILTPVAHPWYLTWLAALVVLRWSLATFVLLGLSNLSNIVVYHYKLTGEWHDQPLILLVEYIPFYILLGVDMIRRRQTSRADLTSSDMSHDRKERM